MDYCQLLSQFHDILKKNGLIENVSEKFNKKPPHEKVSFIYDMLTKLNLLPKCKRILTKSADKALEFRNLGNKAYGLRNDLEALQYYTESVAVSPSNSKELAFAYANRSAVLFKFKKYDLCLLDINRSLSQSYPDSLKPKLLERKDKCLLELKTSPSTHTNTLDSFSQLILNEEDDCISSNVKVNNSLPNHKNDYEIINTRFVPPFLPSKNKLIRNGSEKIEINFTFEMGRHLIATQDIEPGEILAVEKPYASTLLPNFFHTHCAYCFLRNEAMIPCSNCSLVMFCSTYCRDAALKRFHNIECSVLPFLLSLRFDKFCLLSFRILLIASEQGQKLNNLINNPYFNNPISGKHLNLNEEYISEDYRTVHNLEDNFFKRSVSDLFQKSTESALMLHLLKQSTFFGVTGSDNSKSTNLSKFESFTGTLLLKYLLAVLSNAHEISELIVAVNNHTESLEIGSALYPLLSLTNHSCDPNVVRHSYGNVIVLRSIQCIKTSEQIFDNYGYHFAVHKLEERRTPLTLQYFFECHCNPCTYNWPLYVELASENPEYISERVDLVKLKKSSNDFNKRLKERKFDAHDLLNSICKHLSLLHNSIKRPWKEYCECQELIKQVLAYKANCYFHSSDLILIKKMNFYFEFI